MKSPSQCIKSQCGVDGVEAIQQVEKALAWSEHALGNRISDHIENIKISENT